MAKAPRKVAKPGTDPQAQEPAADRHDDDAAIAAGQAGTTHKVAKQRPAVPASRIKGDPERPGGMPVNAKREMPYEEAMAQKRAGTLERSTLTEKGWVMPDARTPPAGAKA